MSYEDICKLISDCVKDGQDIFYTIALYINNINNKKKSEK